MESIKDKISKLTYVAEFQKKQLIDDLFGDTAREEDVKLLLETTVDEVFRRLFGNGVEELNTAEATYLHDVIAGMTKEFIYGK